MISFLISSRSTDVHFIQSLTPLCFFIAPNAQQMKELQLNREQLVCTCMYLCICLCACLYTHIYIYIYNYIYPDMAKHQSKPQVYKSDIAPCGQI